MDKKFVLLIISGVIVLSLMGFFTVNAIQSSNLTQQLELAKESFDKEEYEKSIEAYQNVLTLDPLNVQARLGLSEALLALSYWDEAEATLEEGIELLSTEASFYSYLSTVYVEQLKIMDALELLNEGVSITNSATLIEEYELLEAPIRIRSRHLVQQGFSRPLTLVWERAGESVPLEANWTVADETIGTLDQTEPTDRIRFSGEELGKTVVTATISDMLSIDREIEVREQVLKEMFVTPEVIETLSVGQSVTLSVEGIDAADEPMEFIPEWSIEGEMGHFDHIEGVNTTFTAAKAGAGTLNITYEDFQHQVDIVIEGDEHIISVEKEGQGDVIFSPSLDSFPTDTEVTIEARPHSGWKFVKWEGDLVDEANPTIVTITENLNIRAIFEEDNEVMHSLSLDRSGEGEIIRSSLASTFAHLDTITLTARPKDGWTFKGWEGSFPSTTDRITLTMDSDKTMRAVFVQNEPEPRPEPEPQQPETPSYTLSLNAGEGGQITKDLSGSSFKSGTRVTLTASPLSGWKFERWEGSTQGTSRTTTVTMDGNKSVRAVFSKVEEAKPEPTPEPENFTLTTSTSGDGSIEGNSGSTHKEGSTVTLTARPAPGWDFQRWEGDVTGNSPTVSVTMNRNKSVRAVFVQRVVETEDQTNE